LSEKLAILDRAARAIGQKNGAEALSRLDEHAARFPRGVLAPEASVLRVEALMVKGDREEAQALADRFVAAHPTSPFAEKARRLVGGAKN
jgi:outer membrane protein assembly factor BamD (BamD/ComL family)